MSSVVCCTFNQLGLKATSLYLLLTDFQGSGSAWLSGGLTAQGGACGLQRETVWPCFAGLGPAGWFQKEAGAGVQLRPAAN